MKENELKKLEETIGYKFNNKKYLKIALTHKSYLDEQSGYLSNQRYEFLGDTILDFDLTIYLFNNFPELDEGNLTKKLSFLVPKSFPKSVWISRWCQIAAHGGSSCDDRQFCSDLRTVF